MPSLYQPLRIHMEFKRRTSDLLLGPQMAVRHEKDPSMFRRALAARHMGQHKRWRRRRRRRAEPAVPFLLIALMGAAISGITMLASRSPHWPAAVADCSLPAYKSERPPCPDNLVLRPATPPFKGASAPPSAFELEY